jgi:hypothetical protein
MPGTKERPYRQASLPGELMQQVEWVVHTFPELGYQSPTEFIRAATRGLLREVEGQLDIKMRLTDRTQGGPRTFLRREDARRPVKDD